MQTKSKAGRTQVAPNLYRQTAAGGTASWVLRYQLCGVKRWMGLGPVTTLSLREATARAGAAQKLLLDGIDPIADRRTRLATEVRKAILSITFEAAAGQYYDQHQIKWAPKSRDAFTNTMRDHVYPTIGMLPVDKVDTAMVLKVIEPLWMSKNVTATRVRSRVEAVLSWAAVRGFRPAGDNNNPARWKGHLSELLPVGGELGAVEHHAALAYVEVPAFLATLRQRQGIGARALEFTVLTAARSGEVRLATWSEVDFDAKVWTRPASHMKAGVEHSIPLGPRAIEILQALPGGDRDGDGLIFAGADGRPLGKNAMGKMVEGTGVTVHGFRSSFRDWCGERTNFARELAEHSLAHTVGGKVENAYARSALCERRRRLMEAWEGFIAVATPAASVTPIRKGA